MNVEETRGWGGGGGALPRSLKVVATQCQTPDSTFRAVFP